MNLSAGSLDCFYRVALCKRIIHTTLHRLPNAPNTDQIDWAYRHAGWVTGLPPRTQHLQYATYFLLPGFCSCTRKSATSHVDDGNDDDAPN